MSFDGTSDDMYVIVKPNTPTMTSKSFESPCAEYSFMVVPIDSSFSKSPEFFFKIQQMVSMTSFSACLEFVSEFNIPLSAGLNVCPLRHLIYLILPSLGVIFRVSTALHLPVTYIDDINKADSNLQ